MQESHTCLQQALRPSRGGVHVFSYSFLSASLLQTQPGGSTCQRLRESHESLGSSQLVLKTQPRAGQGPPKTAGWAGGLASSGLQMSLLATRELQGMHIRVSLPAANVGKEKRDVLNASSNVCDRVKSVKFEFVTPFLQKDPPSPPHGDPDPVPLTSCLSPHPTATV